MPRPPRNTPSTESIKGSVYSSLGHKLASFSGETFPFHVGDTWLEPPFRVQDLAPERFRELNRYTPPHGLPSLLELLLERFRKRTGLPLGRENLLVTGGATSGLANVAGAIVSPGDEVLILAPHWPLIDGIVRSFGGVPVAVPFMGLADSPESAIEIVSEKASDRTVALYFNTPNNPTGRVIPHSVVEALAEWSRRENIWILSDEVYEDYQFAGDHTLAFPLAPERTFSIHSFSKALGMAGYRCGFTAGPKEPMHNARKIHTHTVYSASTPAQAAVEMALSTGAAGRWIEKARAVYQETGERAARRIGAAAPEGSTFLFVDVSSALGENGLGGFLETCADHGLFAAPGPSFGPYPHHIRVCFTATPPDNVMRGMDVLARILGREKVSE